MSDYHIAVIAGNADDHSTMLKELRSLGPVNQRKIIKLRDRYEALFRKVIADGVKERLFRDVHVKITSLALLGMMNGLIHWYSPIGPMNSEHIAGIFSDLLLDGLLADNKSLEVKRNETSEIPRPRNARAGKRPKGIHAR